MDIRNWPMDKILQLPDGVFGRRWPVSVSAKGTGPIPTFDIAEMAFPERIVVWEVQYNGWRVDPNVVQTVRIGLADQLPVTVAVMDTSAPFLRSLGFVVGGLTAFYLPNSGNLIFPNLKVGVETGGRRLVGYFVTLSTDWDVWLTVTVSSIPTEVPDCLLSV